MGKSGSGKTTFYNNLKQTLKDHLYLNGDQIRKEYNDWSFSYVGRLRQANRMKRLAEESINDLIIFDFICPLKETRKIINPDIIFFINREGNKKYNDTDSIFEPPTADESPIIYTIN